MTGIVSDIQRFSIHDGPGIRTTVFLKGCNLRCAWCHNPETIHPRPQLQRFPDKCIACGACLSACPRGAHALEGGRRVFRRDRCAACGACAKVCYAEALVIAGREMPAEAVAEEVLRDRAFQADSGGGVTLSGGEPLLQAEFARDILARCRQAGVHTAVETNLCWPWERAWTVLESADLVMADFKTADDDLHRRWTGASNRPVLDNLLRLARTQRPLIVRTPVIPTVNDTPEEIGRMADFLAGLDNLLYYELLPYHPLGSVKYASLDSPLPPEWLQRPRPDTLLALAEAASRRGLRVRAPGRRAPHATVAEPKPQT